MIKFGNDIVTVGGDWLKYQEPPVKLAEYPLQQIRINPTQYVSIFTSVPATESNYAVIKVNCSEIHGALAMLLSANNSDVTIDLATGSAQQINFASANMHSIVAYDGTVSSKVITLSNWHIINRIILDFNERKVYFYDTNNVIVAQAGLWGGTSHYQPLSISMQDPDSSNQTICKVSGEIWQCYTMEQALSV